MIRILKISDLAKLISVLVLFLYVVGFIIVNSYLTANGVFIHDFFNNSYLIAGSVYAFALVVFAYFAGRRIYFLNEDIKSFSIELGLKWWGILFSVIFVLSEIIFSCLVSSLIVTNFLFVHEGSRQIFYRFLFLYIFWDYFMWTKGFYQKHLFITLIIALFFYIAGVFIVIHTHDKSVKSVFYFYLSLGFLINFIFDFYERTGKFLLSMFWTLLSIVLVAHLWGTLYFGRIKNQFGGGNPVEARLLLSNEVPQYLRGVLKLKEGLSGIVYILFESKNEMVIQVPTNSKPLNIRVSKTLIKAILPVPERRNQ